MSKRKDRERASKGLVFRGGKLVQKENEPEEASPEEAAEMIEQAHRQGSKTDPEQLTRTIGQLSGEHGLRVLRNKQ